MRRNKDEEPSLVSYIVPDLQKWPQWLESKDLSKDDDVKDDTMVGMLKRFQMLREDAKKTLKKKLPHYAIPSIFIPLRKMPLTPNAKIDKRALPFPDAAELAEASVAGRTARSSFSETEKFVGEVWAQRIPGASADTIDLDDRFFDVGGHSMIGQSVLFDIRKRKGISLSMNTLFQNPTLREFAAVLDAASGLSHNEKSDSTPPEMDYHLDGELLGVKAHIEQIPTAQSRPQNFLVTGATGFLGAHILADLLKRTPPIKTFVHVRASSTSDALQRIEKSCEAYGVWDPKWADQQRIEPILGDLSKPNLGIETSVWQKLAGTVDCIIHNGARYSLPCLREECIADPSLIEFTGFILILLSNQRTYSLPSPSSNCVPYLDPNHLFTYQVLPSLIHPLIPQIPQSKNPTHFLVAARVSPQATAKQNTYLNSSSVKQASEVFVAA